MSERAREPESHRARRAREPEEPESGRERASEREHVRVRER